MLRNMGWKDRAMLLWIGAVLGVGIALVLHGDAWVARDFGKKLSSRALLSLTSAGAAAQARSAVGDEGFWLTRAEVESPAPFAKPLAVGDRITISAQDGRERQLEVIDLKTIGAGTATRVVSEAGHNRLLLVTCRVLGGAGRQGDAPVRFIVEAEPVTTNVPTPAKAL
jgi:hypothetical protein